MKAKKEIKALEQQYNVKAFLTIIFINPYKEFVFQIVGSVGSKKLILHA